VRDIWVTVPTAGRDTLEAAIDSTGVSRSQFAVVVTAPDVRPPVGCLVLPDFGAINIHRWWLRGIMAAVDHGARYVAVINDDVLLDADTLPTLVAALEETGAAIASPGGDVHVTDPNPGLPMTLVGSCYVLDTATGLRPDQRFRWWFGDNFLDLRARRDFGGVVTRRCYFHHLEPNRLTAANPELQRLAEQDERTWAAARLERAPAWST
jgi:hypothetical protein